MLNLTLNTQSYWEASKVPTGEIYSGFCSTGIVLQTDRALLANTVEPRSTKIHRAFQFWLTGFIFFCQSFLEHKATAFVYHTRIMPCTHSFRWNAWRENGYSIGMSWFTTQDFADCLELNSWHYCPLLEGKPWNVFMLIILCVWYSIFRYEDVFRSSHLM